MQEAQDAAPFPPANDCGTENVIDHRWVVIVTHKLAMLSTLAMQCRTHAVLSTQNSCLPH